MRVKRTLIKLFVGVTPDVCTAMIALSRPGPAFDVVTRTSGRGEHTAGTAVAGGNKVAWVGVAVGVPVGVAVGEAVGVAVGVPVGVGLSSDSESYARLSKLVYQPLVLASVT